MIFSLRTRKFLGIECDFLKLVLKVFLVLKAALLSWNQPCELIETT
jgi:hypothetical protein